MEKLESEGIIMTMPREISPKDFLLSDKITPPEGVVEKVAGGATAKQIKKLEEEVGKLKETVKKHEDRELEAAKRKIPGREHAIAAKRENPLESPPQILRPQTSQQVPPQQKQQQT